MTPALSAFLAEAEARATKARCPRCKGSLVHDFESECWVQDRCTDCQATWFNDPPRPASDAPFFRHPDDILRALEIIRKQDAAIHKLIGVLEQVASPHLSRKATDELDHRGFLALEAITDVRAALRAGGRPTKSRMEAAAVLG